MKQADEYVKIPELARRLGVCYKSASRIAHCARLKMRKGAVLDISMGKGKYRVWAVNWRMAVETFDEGTAFEP